MNGPIILYGFQTGHSTTTGNAKDTPQWTNIADLLALRVSKHISIDVGLTAFVENKNITDWFNSCNVDDDAYYTGICITKKNATQLHVTFTSGRKKSCHTYYLLSNVVL